ncbi:ImmA/IrrE family metallo-endopeptidase [Marinicella sp. W31]|uniref:ImmA/IrrE family metallo-endopeptidase n=1 Tax=Marinicella sp. W31 TaxID=3023713 RepID=UPI00375801E2
MELSGRKIAESTFSDIEKFFYHGAKFRVKRQFNQNNMKSHAMCAGSGNDMRIRLSRDFCEFQATSINDYMFMLIILSHELAHYLNNHNSYSDTEKLDSIAIEARADHFGAQIFMTLFTFGKNTQKHITDYKTNTSQKARFKAIAVAISDVYEKLFKPANTKKYPDAEHRGMLLIVGCLSFFNRYFRPLPEKFAVAFLKTVIRESNLIQNTDGEKQLDVGEVIQNRIYDIHREIESKARFQMAKMKEPYGYFLSADFSQTNEARKAHKEKLDKMINGWNLINED